MSPEPENPMPQKVEPTDEPRRLNAIEKSLLEAEVIEGIRTVYDPEIPVNVYDLGLIYDIQISDEAMVDIKMTLTSPACPVAGTLPGEVERAAKVRGVEEVRLELVWDPPFSIDRIPEHIRLDLGIFY
jgi:FeS assembly SUF system protein